MYQKREACRNFQRGSCRYGDRCRFSHATTQQQQPQQQQQPRPNPFGFGALSNSQSKGPSSAFGFGSNHHHHQQQNQKPNPFGFGTQTNSQPKSPSSAFGSNQHNQFKPFENKWIRSSPSANANQTSDKPQGQGPAPAPADHDCTNRDSCKKQIAQDFQQESPLWKLTCYGHWKHLPCDIHGDISYEELRAAAYDDAKRGLDVSAIIERERSLLNSKLLEFQNFLNSPNNVPGGPRPFSGSNPGPVAAPFQNNAPPSVPSFSHLGISTNQGSSTSSLASSNNSFWQTSTKGSSHISGGFGVDNRGFGTQGLFPVQQAMQSPGGTSTNSQMGSGSAASLNFPNAASSKTTAFSNGQNAASLSGQASVNNINEDVLKDASIYLKEAWNPGEIPEEAPPAEFVR